MKGKTIFLTAILLCSFPLKADFLVLKDGSVIKTKGKWKVKGKRVLFYTQEGIYTFIRLDKVDLEKSAALSVGGKFVEKKVKKEVEKKSQDLKIDKESKTISMPTLSVDSKEKQEPLPSLGEQKEKVESLGVTDQKMKTSELEKEMISKEIKDEKEKKSDFKVEKVDQEKQVIKITDEDIPPAVEKESSEKVELKKEEDGKDKDTDNKLRKDALKIIGWSKLFDIRINGLKIRGRVINNSPDPVTNVKIEVTLLDEEGRKVTKEAKVKRSTLAPEQTTSFIVEFPGIYDVEEPQFKVDYTSFSVEIGGPPESEGNR